MLELIFEDLGDNYGLLTNPKSFQSLAELMSFYGGNYAAFGYYPGVMSVTESVKRINDSEYYSALLKDEGSKTYFSLLLFTKPGIINKDSFLFVKSTGLWTNTELLIKPQNFTDYDIQGMKLHDKPLKGFTF